jgi:hypothetical protein
VLVHDMGGTNWGDSTDIFSATCVYP